MKRQLSIFILGLAVASEAAAASNWQSVDDALGRAGTVQPGDVHRYSFPRSDLAVTLDGVRIEPALALGSWLAFPDVGDHGGHGRPGADAGGGESSPFASARGAADDHRAPQSPAPVEPRNLVYARPRRWRCGEARDRPPPGALRESYSDRHPTPAKTQAIGLDTKALDAALHGKERSQAARTSSLSLARSRITDHGMFIPASMGLTTAINFQPTGNGRAVATADFVLIESVVTPVLTELRRRGVEVTALHNHLSGEQPRLFFMHFWGNADTATLAQSLRAALDHMNLGS